MPRCRKMAASASSELAPQAQNYSRHNNEYERYKRGMDYRCHDRIGANEFNAKHRNQKRAANGRTYQAKDKVRHQSSSLVAERGDTTEHESNHHNDNENLSLKAHLGVS